MDTITLTRPPVATQPRQPALHGFIVRRRLAASARPGRHTVIEGCKAELVWAVADWRRIHPRGYEHEREVEALAASCHLPHERAAGVVLNCWGHLHPIEYRVRENIKVLRGQIKAGWAPRAERTRDHLRLILADRRKAAKAFFAAVETYRRLRNEIDAKEVA